LTTARNLLIVEDDSEWCGIYARAAARHNVRAVKVANDLADATALIENMQFAIAFIDIGLDVGDDRNIDGLRVMDKIRSMKDETSIVVVTGRSGMDVLPITRDAIMRYRAHNILGKVEISPSDIDEALTSGLAAFEKRNSLSAAPAHAVLKGDLEPWKWDDLMMRGTGIQGDVQNLYRFLDRLISGFLPLIPVQPGAAIQRDESTGVMHGSYWSRAIGAAVVVCFAGNPPGEPQPEWARSGRFPLEGYDAGAALNELSAHGVTGAVFALNGATRDDFAQS
jgi:ActR/RegA family two-component response regulator